MRFKIDENLPAELAVLLRQADHEALTVPDQGLSGGTDSRVAQVCQRERRCLITLDTDFADVRAYPPGEYCGIIVLRLRRQDKPSTLAVVADLIRMLSREPLERHLWIVEEDRVRIRG